MSFEVIEAGRRTIKRGPTGGGIADRESVVSESAPDG